MDPEDKQARREAILAAALRLFEAGDGPLPGAGGIAAAAGLAKGTVYLYFRTKEEIFVALLQEGIEDVLGEIAAAFHGGRAKAGRGVKVAAFLAAYVAAVERRPDVLRLDAMCYVLEKNLTGEKLREFKQAFVVRLAATGEIVEGALGLPAGRGAQLLMRTFAMTRGLWQAAEPRGEMARVEVDKGVLAEVMCPEFAVELREALAEYWRGALR